MRRVVPDGSWPESWTYSYRYDLMEVYGDRSERHYTFPYANRVRKAVDLVRSVSSPPASVLDVAGGQGNVTLQLAELGYDVTWNDIRSDLVGYVQLKHDRGKVKYCPGNVFDVEFDACFDVVLLAEVIEHVAHPDELLRRARSLVCPEGHVVITTPNVSYFIKSLPRFS